MTVSQGVKTSISPAPLSTETNSGAPYVPKPVSLARRIFALGASSGKTVTLSVGGADDQSKLMTG
ncbi:MAG: hypothetical protein ACTSPE_03680 [Candidatus Thorarchaeota archaeon]